MKYDNFSSALNIEGKKNKCFNVNFKSLSRHKRLLNREAKNIPSDPEPGLTLIEFH